MFSCEFCEISKNTFFTEHVCANASRFITTKETPTREVLARTFQEIFVINERLF